MRKKRELKYIVMAVAFAFIWFIIAIPKLLQWGVENSSPYTQFIFFNIGVFIFLNIFLKAKATSQKTSIMSSLRLVALFIALEIYYPPFMINIDGTLMNGAVLSQAGADYVLGYFAIQLGLSGILIPLFVYVFMPGVLLFITSRLIRDFISEI